MSSSQPGNSIYTGCELLKSFSPAGTVLISFPLTIYDVAIFNVSIPESTSNKVIEISVSPETLAACLTRLASNQPILLGLPVVTPYSLPTSLICLEVSSSNSVGNPPVPTLVE